MQTVNVTVIVPVYNLERYVRECIESLTRQETDFVFEVIAVDDASNDNSFQILKELEMNNPGLLKVYRNDQNQGLAKTMKRLLSLASGEYIAYLDGDDIALSGKLQIQKDYLDKHPNCSIVYHESDVFDSETDKTLWTYTKDYYNRKYIKQQATIEDVIRYGCFMQASTVMIRRHEHLLEAVDEQNKILLDHPWHVLNLRYGQGSIDFINKTLGRYRIHQDSFGARTLRSVERRKQVLRDQLNVCSLGCKAGVSEAVVQAGRYHYIYATALFFIKNKEDELFREYIDKSTDGTWFFDDRHKKIYLNREQPGEIRNTYFKD